MNDFTKEELEDIHLVYRTFCNDDGVQRKITNLENGILSKLKSMIDNYDAQVIQVWHCEKCGHVQ